MTIALSTNDVEASTSIYGDTALSVPLPSADVEVTAVPIREEV